MYSETYKEEVPYKDMVEGVIYVRFVMGKWEAVGKSKKGVVYGMGAEELMNLPHIVAAVFNSVKKDEGIETYITGETVNGRVHYSFTKKS